MRPSREIQWDLEMAPPGGTFLVLNPDTNTVGLGNGCFFQTFPPAAIWNAQPPESNPPASSNHEAIDNIVQAATVVADGDSSGEEDREFRRLRHMKMKGKDDNDPDFAVPWNAKLKKPASAVRMRAAARSTEPEQDIDRSLETPALGSKACTVASISYDSVQPGQVQLHHDGLPRSLDGSENGMPSSIEPPPPYLVKLLQFYGWTVTFDEGQGAVYRSPGGLTYHSLPKAFEKFLQESSPGGETLDSQDLNHNTTLSSQDAGKERSKGRRGRKKKIAAQVSVSSPVTIPGPSETQSKEAGKQETREIHANMSPGLPQEASPSLKEMRQMDITWGMTARDSSRKKNLDVQLPGPRRSARLCGRYTFYGSESDPEDNEDDSSLYAPEADQEMPTSLGDSDTVFEKKDKKPLEDEVCGWKKLDYGIDLLSERNSITHQDNQQLEVHSTDDRVKGHSLVSMGLELEKEQAGNSVHSSKINNNVVKNKEDKVISLERQMLDGVHKGTTSCNNPDHLMKETEVTELFLNNNNVFKVDAGNKITDVEGYMDLNRRLVFIGDGSGPETGLGYASSSSSLAAIATNSLTTSTIAYKPSVSTIEPQKAESGRRTSDNNVLKDGFPVEIVPRQIPSERTGKECMEKPLQEGDNLTCLVPSRCSSLSASKRKKANDGHSNDKRKKRGRCGTARENIRDDNKKKIISPKKVTAISWLIDAGVLSENEILMHRMENDGADPLRGLATRDGILCVCCKKIISLSDFDFHGGSVLCQPWYNICIESGMSLMQCQIEAWEKEKKLKTVGFHTTGLDGLDPNDDTCGVCADGGNLICCDICPSTFHQDCLLLKDFPDGRWQCPYCVCTFCSVGEDGADIGNQDLTLFTCQQCYRKYHWECTRKSGQHGDLAESLLFCGKNCKEVDAGLFKLLGAVNKIGEGFSWTLLKRLDEHEELNSDQKLLLMMECNRKLSMSLSVLDECFVPPVDAKTGVDLIAHAVYNCGSNLKRLNYAGFYHAILEKDEEIISVASIRFHGKLLAEVPFIGTQPVHQRQGMCRRLLKALEDLLSSLHVEKLIIPARPELVQTWMTSFSFRPLEQSDQYEIKNLSLLTLPQTILLQKTITPKAEDTGDLAGATAAASTPAKAAAGARDDAQGGRGEVTVAGRGPQARSNPSAPLFGAPSAPKPPARHQDAAADGARAAPTGFSSFSRIRSGGISCREAIDAGDASAASRSGSMV